MIPEWFQLRKRAEKLERDSRLTPEEMQRLHSAIVQLVRTRQALGSQHPMEQTAAYQRLDAEYKRLALVYA